MHNEKHDYHGVNCITLEGGDIIFVKTRGTVAGMGFSEPAGVDDHGHPRLSVPHTM